FVQIPDSPVLDLTNAISVEAWVYINAFPAIDVVSIVTKQDSSASIAQYQLALWNSPGGWRFRPVIVISGQWTYFAGTTVPQLGTWYHLVTTYDGASLKLYVNGVLDGSQPASGPILTTSGPLLIGGGAINWFFNGRVDEVSLYDRSLSASEVQAIYT